MERVHQIGINGERQRANERKLTSRQFRVFGIDNLGNLAKGEPRLVEPYNLEISTLELFRQQVPQFRYPFSRFVSRCFDFIFLFPSADISQSSPSIVRYFLLLVGCRFRVTFKPNGMSVKDKQFISRSNRFCSSVMDRVL